MESWHSKAYELSIKGYNSREICEILEDEYGKLNQDCVRSYIKRERTRHGTKRDCSGKPIDSEVHKIDIKGEVKTFNDITECDTGEEITPSSIMKAKGLNAEDWEVISFTKNVWQQQNKDGEKINLCQSKLTVKPIIKRLTIDNIDAWFESKDFSKVPKKTSNVKLNNNKLIAEICCSDIHFGLLAWAEECGGQDWDLHISKEKFLKVTRDIVDRLKNDKIKEVYFCTLGDVLHIDNVQGTTTKGTIQQVDGRISKIIDFAYDTLNEALEMVRELEVPIHYVYVCGNHDNAMGYALARMLQIANSDIDFNVSPNPQKAIHFGKVLIGLNHGDIPKANKGQWLINDYRKEYGESDYTEIHSGHIHTEEVKIYNGVKERSVIAQTGQSLWEYSMAYRSQRGIQCFVWDEELGLRDIKYSIY